MYLRTSWQRKELGYNRRVLYSKELFTSDAFILYSRGIFENAFKTEYLFIYVWLMNLYKNNYASSIVCKHLNLSGNTLWFTNFVIH